MLEEVRSQSNNISSPFPSQAHTLYINKSPSNRWRTKGSRKEGASHKSLENTGDRERWTDRQITKERVRIKLQGKSLNIKANEPK